MKTMNIFRIPFIILMLICISGFATYAFEPVTVPPAQYLQQVIKEKVKYPEQAVRSSSTGTVDVIFTVTNEGKINIKKTFSDNRIIEKIVKDQLSSINFQGARIPSYEQYKVRITFKLI